MHPAKKSPHPESGNILIYILGAIFLLGILVVMVKGSSTPGSNIDEEALMIRVAEVQEYGAELESAVALILSNGFSETDIRFAHPNAPSAYGVITDTPERQVFSRSGGGATYRENPGNIQTVNTSWVFTGNNHVHGVGTSSCGPPTCIDLVAILPYVSQSFCDMINKKNNTLTSTGNSPQDCGSVDIATPFTGTYTNSNQILDGAGCGQEEVLLGKSEGCFEGQGSPAAGTYHYYRVLHAR
jgi:hypothetical protein